MSTATAGSVPERQSNPSGKEIDLTTLKPKNVDREDCAPASQVDKIWEKMYSLSGLTSMDELQRKGFRLAVYVYMAVNGASREGIYSGDITTFSGKVFSSSVIPRATGRFAIRKFLRSNMNESYLLLKESRALSDQPRFIKSRESYGVSEAVAFATCDWMADCPLFTPEETRAYDLVHNRSLERAVRARNGKTLEEVEGARVDDMLQASGARKVDTTVSSDSF